MDNFKKWGLVFSGGGAKGAYQIGVWKALNELKLARNIKAVSGSSVGALNALLFSLQKYQLAFETWISITQEDMLYNNNTSKKAIIKNEINNVFNSNNFSESSYKIAPIISIGLLAPAFFPFFTLLTPILKLFCRNCDYDIATIKKLIELIQYSTGKEGFFSQEKLEEIIDNILFVTDNKQKITSFATICKAGDLSSFLKKKDVEYINLVNKTPAQTREIVLASSALPLVYPNRKIDNQDYYDGGWADNTPIKPIYDLGITDIVTVYLENNKHNKLKKDFVEEEINYPKANIMRIIPNNDFDDDIIETLTISPEISKKRIEMGYQDTIQQLGKYYT